MHEVLQCARCGTRVNAEWLSRLSADGWRKRCMRGDCPIAEEAAGKDTKPIVRVVGDK